MNVITYVSDATHRRLRFSATLGEEPQVELGLV
jgi:hypothetical protein